MSSFTSRALTRLTSISRQNKRCLHQTVVRNAVTNLQMPAMSPTMTEGGIASWKKQDGEAFNAGDVLLEIETDKATIDVEAQDDGIMGKILVQDGAKNVQVGKIIALLAEEGDDISNLEAPKEVSEPPKEDASASSKPAESSSSPAEAEPSSPSPSTPTSSSSTSHVKHSGPMFPSVHRLLIEHDISDPSKIKGTGVRGMLTKGDVLAYLGKASSPLGTYKVSEKKESKPQPKKEEVKALDGPAVRRLIVNAMLKNSMKARTVPPPSGADFDSIIADYLPKQASTSPSQVPSVPPTPKASSNYLDGLF